jgi:decaprenylphospho-beta-D-erythro-pentofuranosid-2-ulose 2-reductase
VKKILVVGSTSKIVQYCLYLWASENCEFFLVAKDAKKNELISHELISLGAKSVHTYSMNVNDFDAHRQMFEEAKKKLIDIDLAFIGHGMLPDQENDQNNADKILKSVNTNAISVINLLTIIAEEFEKKNYGHIAIISSVAADRGRASNYIYGSSKAMISFFAEGLRQRLYKSNINITVIKPGLIKTPMTLKFKKNFLWSEPSKIALKIVNAINKKKDEVYVPTYWYFIMIIIKLIPNFLFKKLKL